MSADDRLPLIILGGGGHARVLADGLRQTGRQVLGFTAPAFLPALAPGIAWLGDDTMLADHPPDSVLLVNGIGSSGATGRRRTLFEALRARGYGFAGLIHPTVIRSALGTRLGLGCQLLAGSLLGPEVTLGDNVLINSRAVVEHDCHIGSHSHVATGAILCGGVRIGEGVHIGAGATVIQGIAIGSGTIVAAGAVVTKNVEPLTLVAGVPGVVKRALHEENLEGHQPEAGRDPAGGPGNP